MDAYCMMVSLEGPHQDPCCSMLSGKLSVRSPCPLQALLSIGPMIALVWEPAGVVQQGQQGARRMTSRDTAHEKAAE